MIYIYVEVPTKTEKHNLQKKKINTIEEGVEKFQKFIHDNLWGASDFQFFESGLICSNDKPIARVSYNGRVWDVTDKDLHDWESHVEITEEQFNDFLEKVK